MKVTGSDRVGVKLIKAGAIRLSHHLYPNYSTYVFPQLLFRRYGKPLFKNGDKTKADNYRPISILTVISKIIERHVHNTLMKELQNRNLIYHLQSGFRRKYSTETALIADQLLFSLDNDEVSGLLLVDFRKAFDMVNHQLLLNKLRAFGVGKRSVEWFQSYLLNRYQFVSVNGVSLEKLCIQSGVPQGSGPSTVYHLH